MVNEIRCLGTKIKCNLTGLNSKNLDFYRSFLYKDTTFITGEFVLVNDNANPGRIKVAQILGVYYSKEPGCGSLPYRASVRWYILARDLDSKIDIGAAKLDKTNEVVEYIQEHNISLTDIVTKCCIVLGMVDDSNACIAKNNMDPKASFFCRYRVQENQLVPLLCNYRYKYNNNMTDSVLHSIMDHENCDNLMVVVTSDDFDSEEELYNRPIKTKKNKRKNINISLGSDGSESEMEQMNQIKVNSPFNSSKSLKLSNGLLNGHSGSSSSDKSAIASPPPYSIIQPINIENGSLKMKLKIMDYFRPVNVYPTQLDKEIMNLGSPVNIDNIVEKNNCVLLSPSANLDLFKTPSRNNGVEVVESRSRRNCTLKYTPQRRSRRISSQTKLSYTEYNNSIVFDDIEEESLAKCVDNISLQNTPCSQTKRQSRTSNRKTTASKKFKANTPLPKIIPTKDSTEGALKRQTDSCRITRSSRLVNNVLKAEPQTVSTKKTNKILNGNLSNSGNQTPKKCLSANESSEHLNSIRKKLQYDSDDNMEASTPKRRNVKSRSSISRNNTPSARAKMIREGLITPSVPTRNRAVLKNNTPLFKARTQLHVSYVPQALPCRENEFSNISNFLSGKLCEGCGGCMYISGVPGTGKTATVTEVIKGLESYAKNKVIPKFNYVNINCMRLSEPRQAYVEIAKQLIGKTVAWEQAQSLLEDKFINSKAKSLPIILVVDELDILCNKRQDVVYNLLDWPTKANMQLIVVAIANTMDLPERLLVGRVTSRLGLTRLTFQAYTHKQLQEIVTKRLSGTNTFNPDAIQLVARKVASVSGDARRALDICRRAAEIAEIEGKSTLVSMKHVNQALTAMITQPKVQAIKHCCKLEKLVLQAIVAEVDRTGIEETNFQHLYQTLTTLATLEGFPVPSITIVKSGLARLSACRLLLVDQKCSNIYQKIILNVSIDDIHYALTN